MIRDQFPLLSKCLYRHKFMGKKNVSSVKKKKKFQARVSFLLVLH